MKLLALTIMSSLVLGSAQIHAEDNSPLLIGTIHYPPFIICDNNNKVIDGLDIRTIYKLFEGSGQTIKIACMPWRRLLHLVASGEIDGGFPGFKTSDREEWANFVDTPLHFESHVVVTKLGHEFKLDSIGDLNEKTLGLNSGFVVSEKFSEAVGKQNFKLQQQHTTAMNLKLLLQNRLDAYIGNLTVIGYTINELGMDNRFSILPKRLTPTREVYLFFSKKSKNSSSFINSLSKKLRLMRQDKTIQRITNQYLDVEIGLDDAYCPQHEDEVTIDW